MVACGVKGAWEWGMGLTQPTALRASPKMNSTLTLTLQSVPNFLPLTMILQQIFLICIFVYR